MNYEALILNRLLDKYENRTPDSNRRVRIVFIKNEVDIPDMEDTYSYSEFRESMLKLKDKGFIDIEWERKDYILKSVSLNLESTDAVYRYLNRRTHTSKITSILNKIKAALNEISLDWIRNFLETEQNNICSKGKISGIWNKDENIVYSFIEALEGIDKLRGNSVSMRAFSVKIYHDSKRFEREIKQLVIPVIKRFEPNLTDIEDITEREVLAQVGIIMMPEVFEFCGNIKINFLNGKVDFSPITKTACISSECVSEIQSIEIFDTDKIIFIENKTNFSEYCLNTKNKRELIVYHGGFYSPQRGEFFHKLCEATNLPIYFWGDIDYGGFKMYMRLKNNIIPNLLPLNMDLASFNRYKSKGLSKNDEYIAKLGLLKNNKEYHEFFNVIDAMITEKTTVEQEAFLEN